MLKKVIFALIILLLAAGGAGLYFYQKKQSANQSSQTSTTAITPSTTSNQTTTTTPTPTPQSQFALPVANYKTGQTKKPFGIYITPATSPVQPERFTGYHTGVDVEQIQDNTDVPVYAIYNGTVCYVNYVSGYGGVIVIEFSHQNQTYTALYGHIRLASATVKMGDNVTKSEQLAVLGTGYSTETDNERKHLHFSIHEGSSVVLAGYVQNQSELSAWIDPDSIIN